MTLEEIVNNLKSAGQDYGQLFNNNPRMDSFASVLQKGVGQLIPSNADFKSPEAMRDWGTAAALNAPMGLAVSGYGNAKQIGDILDKKYGSKIDADISGSNKGLTLDKILIEKENRNQGLGSSFLKDLTQYADSSQQPMSLTAAGDFGGSKAKQIDLYKRFGFLENKGKNKDYSISNNMYRNPQEQIINPNLNFELLNKHLSGQKLTPEEMALYEANGAKMETPQLQRYNLDNANAQGGSPESRAGILGWDTPVYHGRYKDYAKPKKDTTMYTSDNPDYASLYTHPSASSLGGKKQSDFEDLQPNVMPLLQRSKDILDTRTANGLKIFNNDFYRKYGNGTPLTDKGLPDWVDAHDFG
jgi:GNAT superfamily N-acetyltransferase